MTPYSKAAHILEAVEAEALTSGVELPEKRYAQVGDPVVTCAEVIVACSSVNPDELTLSLIHI